jgi:hypothetical protein
MTSAIDLIQEIEDAGGQFMIDGAQLGIRSVRIERPVFEELALQKIEIITILSRRLLIPQGVRLVRWDPKQCPVHLSEFETVVNVDEFVRTTLRQVNARLHAKDWAAGNWTLSALIDRLAGVGCLIILEDPKVALH